MSDLDKQLTGYIDKAREHHLSDDDIRARLAEAGWPAEDVHAALSGGGLDVPVPPAAYHGHSHHASAHHKGEDRPSISALQAALQHVLLWLFTLMSSIMITVVAFALFDDNGGGSSETLLTYMVLELVTFAPFAYFYWQYLRQLKSEPELMTGKVWSIITVVLHSVGLIGSVIGFILVLILVHNDETKAGLVSFAMVGIMNALVVTAYVLANFAKTPKSNLRKWYLQGFPIALFVLIAVLGVWSLFRVGPLRADDQTRQNLAAVAEKVNKYVGDHGRLPSDIDSLGNVPAGVIYDTKDAYTYELCADLRQDYANKATSVSDTYVSANSFYGGNKGRTCWEVTNFDLYSKSDSYLYGNNNIDPSND